MIRNDDFYIHTYLSDCSDLCDIFIMGLVTFSQIKEMPDKTNQQRHVLGQPCYYCCECP